MGLWSFGEGIKNKMTNIMNGHLFGNTPQGDVKAAEESIGKDELAFKMAGTRDKASRAYKSARDRLTRIRSGRVKKPSKATTGKVDQAAKKHRTDQLRQSGSAKVTIVADWQTSKTEWKKGKVQNTLSGEKLEQFTDALDAGDHEAAIQMLCAEYGSDFADAVDGMNEVHSFSIE